MKTKIHLQLDQEELEEMLHEGRSFEFRFSEFPNCIFIVERMR